MKNHNDRSGALGGSLLSLSPGPEKRKEGGSLLSFPAVSARDDATPQQRHARARMRRESRPSDLLGALEHDIPPTQPRPATAAEAAPEIQAADEPSLIEKFLRRGKATSGKPQQPVAPAASAEANDYDQALDRVETLLREQRAEMARLSANVVDNEPSTDLGYEDEPRSEASQRSRSKNDEWKPLIDPARVVRGLVDSRGLIIALTILGGCLGAMVALSMPKKFEATAEIIIDPRDLKIGDRPLTDINGLPSDSTIALVENQVRVLSSGTVLNKVVEDLNLESDPEFNGEGGGIDLNPMNFVRGLLTRSDGSSDPGRRRAITVSNLAERVSVERTGRTFAVLVHATTTDGEKSAMIANKMTEVFLQTSGKMQSDSAGRANSEVVAQLNRLRDEVETAEQKVEKYRADNDLVGAQGRLMTDEEILKLNDQVSAARARTIELNTRAESARQMSVDAIVGGAIPEVASSGMITELRSQYATAKQEADRISVRLGPRHPSYQSAQAQVAAVTRQISTELKRISAQIQTELKRSVQTEQDLAARLAQLKVRQGDVSNELVALRELERDAQAKRSVYEAFLLRANETSGQKEINASNVSIIAPASAPIKSSGPSRVVIAGTGALLGLLGGLGIGVVRGVVGSLGDTAREANSGAPARDNRTPSPRPAARTGLTGRKRRTDEPVESPVVEEPPMHPPYPPHGYAPYPPQPVGPAPQPLYAHPYPQPMAYPPAPQPVYAQPPVPGYPYPQQAYQQPWPPAPPVAQPVYAQPVMPPVYAQPQPYPVYAPQPAPPAPAPQPAAAEPAATGLAQITESVREFRDAVRELADTRLRRRYF